MKLTLQPESEAKLRDLAERSGTTPEQYAEGVLATHVSNYDKWFAEQVQKGLDDVANGRVLSLEESRLRDKARRARLSNAKR